MLSRVLSQWLCNVSGPGEVASTVLRHCVLVALAPPQLDTIGANGEPVYAAADLDALAQDMGTVRVMSGGSQTLP